MRAVSRVGGLAYAIALSIAVLDQLSKSWVTGVIDGVHRSSMEIWGPLRLTLVLNGGVSFGLLQVAGSWGRWILSLFELGVVVVLAVWVRRAERRLSGLAVGLIMGGAMGNVLDRVRVGYVIDFVDVQRLFFPWVFNLADSAITIGVALLLAENLLPPRKAEI
jgi:signal peptidase II